MNLLAIDIGNTNITLGLFKNSRLISKEKMPTHSYSLYNKTLRRFKADKVVICSVVPLALARLVHALGKLGIKDVLIVGRDIKVPIRNHYKDKDEVGQDRLVNAFGASEFYGTPCVIIDFGTAITFDIISKRGDYMGGLILPGIEMGLAALHKKTALLPKVELKPARHIIGRDTIESMRGGILFGYGAMCDGLAAQYKKILGNRTKVIATGGNSHLIKHYSKSIKIVDEDLTLKALKLLSRVSC